VTAAIVFALLSLPAVGQAAVSTLYVDRGNPACSDAGAGSQAAPYCTITKAAKVAVAGQTVRVAGGTYAEGVQVYHSGAAGQPIVFMADPPGSVVMTGGTRSFYISKLSYVTVTGFTTSATTSSGLYVLDSNNITLTGNHVTTSGQPQSGLTQRGIYLSGVTDSVVSGNEVDHNSDSGIYLTGGTTRVTVSSNNIHDNARGYQRAANGIDVRSPGTVVIANWCHDNEDSGIQFYTGGDNNLAVDNVANHNKGTSPTLGVIGDHGIDNLGVVGNRIIGNTLYDNVTAGVNFEGGSNGVVAANNLMVDNGVNSPRTSGNLRFDATSTNGASADSDLAYLSAAKGTNVIWGSGFYTTLANLTAATGQESHGLQADPRWLSPASGDFHLTAQSPAIDSADSGVTGATGTDLAGTARYDYAGTPNTGLGPRGYDDRGAYEYLPAGDNQPPTVNAGPDQNVLLPDAAALSGQAYDDGLPAGTLGYGWSQVAGPAGATIADPSALATTVTFPSAGTYTFRLTASDSALTVADDVAIAVYVPATSPSEVHWTFTGPTSVTVDWRGGPGQLRYGPTAAYGTTVQAATPNPLPFSTGGPFWEAAVSGLQPGVTYHYSVDGSPDATFTAPPTGSLRFDAVGDIGPSTEYPNVATTMNQMAADNPAFALMIGDLTYGNALGQAAVDQHFNDVQAWSRSAAYMPAWGNHEYEPTDDLRNYKGRFALPNAQASSGAPAAGCCGEDWGWFDAGGVRFIAYPEPYISATWTEWKNAVAPLMADAQANPAIHFIVTYGHRPAYSTGLHAGEAPLAAILDAFGDTYSKYVLNLNGHSHDYERFQAIHGVVHITAGGGGSSLEAPWKTTDSRTALRAMHLAHLVIDASPTALQVKAVCGPATSADDTSCGLNSVLDSLTIPAPAG
jgi:parallel beta-helix repeat protein